MFWRQILSKPPRFRPVNLAHNWPTSRFYSDEAPKGGRKFLLDRTSGTLLGVTAGGLLGAFYLSHLEITPETGRRRFMAVSKKQEDQLREMALEQTLEQFRGKILPLHHPLTQEVRRVARRIINASNLGHLEGDLSDPDHASVRSWSTLTVTSSAEIPRPSTMHPEREWVVLVINDMKFVNAFAAPGLVCVSTGIMPVARNEDGLAAVIGHEIGHVTMRHSAEHLSQYKLVMIFAGVLLHLGIDFGLSSLLTRILHSLPNSPALETEADTVGLKLMSRACYKPAAAPRFFQDLKKFEKVDVPTFRRTHPPTLDRIAHLEMLLEDSQRIYESNPECARLDEMRARGILGKMRYELAVR